MAGGALCPTRRFSKSAAEFLWETDFSSPKEANAVSQGNPKISQRRVCYLPKNALASPKGRKPFSQRNPKISQRRGLPSPKESTRLSQRTKTCHPKRRIRFSRSRHSRRTTGNVRSRRGEFVLREEGLGGSRHISLFRRPRHQGDAALTASSFFDMIPATL